MAEPPPAGWWSIWQGKHAKVNMFSVHLAWSIYIVVYYGMLLNIRAFSREHLEINTVIAGSYFYLKKRKFTLEILLSYLLF